jgi:hypothetical protein
VLQASRWETLVWPRWLPVRARLPFIAQITGSVALTALVVGPWWSAIPAPAADAPPAVAVPQLPASQPTAPAPLTASAPQPAPAPAPARPAHLNLDVRHTFGSAELSVTVDGKPALTTRLDGSGKRFKVFGKRAERGFTSTLDLTPGLHVVRVRVRSVADKFDQTRTERFELGSASVAALRIAADKTGLSLAASHPPPVRTAPATVNAPVPAALPAAVPAQAPAPVSAPVAARTTRTTAASAAADLLYRLRSMLIAIAGVVASAATGALVQETLKRRRGLALADGPIADPIDGGRRRRRQAGFLTRDPE